MPLYSQLLGHRQLHWHAKLNWYLGNLNRQFHMMQIVKLFTSARRAKWSSEDMDGKYRSQRSFSEQIEQDVGHFICTQSRQYCHSSLCLTLQTTYTGVPSTWGTCANYQTRHQNHTYDCLLASVWLSATQSLSICWSWS